MMKEAEEEYDLHRQVARYRGRRNLICLCVDASASMSRDDRMETVNREIDRFLKRMRDDPYAKDGLEVCMVAFGNGAEVKCGFGPLDKAIRANRTVEPTASLSELGAGVELALDVLKQRVEYLSKGLRSGSYTPWLILISDGEATDVKRCKEQGGKVQERIRAGKLKVKCLSFDGGEDKDNRLKLFTVDGVVEQVDRLRVEDFFDLLSRSVSSASRQSIQQGGLNLPGGS